MNVIASRVTTSRPIPISALTGVSTAGPLALFDLAGARIRYDRNTEIYAEGDEAEFVYRVVTGTVRITKVLEDGRRQISSFHLAGDLFGLEGGETHRMSAEAVTDCEILMIKRRSVISEAARNPEIASALWTAAAAELGRAQEHMAVLGRKSAAQRLASFLLEMAERGSDSDLIELSMSRTDIADYLGLTIETVSRTFTQFEERNTIRLNGSRRVAVSNPGALRRLDA